MKVEVGKVYEKAVVDFPSSGSIALDPLIGNAIIQHGLTQEFFAHKNPAVLLPSKNLLTVVKTTRRIHTTLDVPFMVNEDIVSSNFNGTITGIMTSFEHIAKRAQIQPELLLGDTIYGPVVTGLYAAAATALLSDDGKKLGPEFIRGMAKNKEDKFQQASIKLHYHESLTTLVHGHAKKAFDELKNAYPSIPNDILSIFLENLTTQ